MAPDPLDYLFLFWTGICAAVYLLGSLYEHQIRSLTNSSSQHQGTIHQRPNQKDNQEQRWNSHHFTGQNSESLGSQQQQPLYSREFQSTSSDSHWTAGSKQVEDQSTSYSRHQVGGQTSPGDAVGDDVGCIPTASGLNADCVEWINNILLLFYTQSEKYGPLLAESLYRSLNEKLSSIVSSSTGHRHLFIEFSGVDIRGSSRPELTNVRTENESDKSVSTILKLYNKCLVLDLSIRNLDTGAQQVASDSAQEQHYELHLENLEGKLRTVLMFMDKLMVIQFVEKPDTKITLRQHATDHLSTYSSRERSGGIRSPLISEDELVSVILQALTQVVVDVYFGDDPYFPRYKQPTTAMGGYKQKLSQLKGSASEIKRQLKQDFFGSLSGAEKERKVFIKLIRATNINHNQTVTCLLELDSPSQQTLSSTKPASCNPVWEEHFLFAVNDKSSELVLELWDSLVVGQVAAGSPDAQGANRRGRFFGGSSSSSSSINNVHHQPVSSSQRLNKLDLQADGAKLLGSARVSVEALRWKPAQRIQLKLESEHSSQNSQKYPVAPACGELHVELMFLEHSTTAASSQPQKLSSVAQIQQGDVVSVERKLTQSGFVITTTTVTRLPKSVAADLGAHQLANSQFVPQSSASHRAIAGSQLTSGSSTQETAAARGQLIRNHSPISLAQSTDQSIELDEEHHLRHSPASSQVVPEVGPHAEEGLHQLDEAASTNTEQQQQQSRRSRSRSRSFLRAIRKRFSFSRTRSRSVGGAGPGDELVGPGSSRRTSRSGSVASSSEVSTNWRAKSLPSSREPAPAELPTIVISRGRGLSHGGTTEASSTSRPVGATKYEFGPEVRSQLVIECLEPTLVANQPGQPQKSHLRYYAVPQSEANKSKWRKRGTKLHLFEDHQFVACHLAGSSTCHLCSRVFSRRPGKQGYKCRNCHLLSHKQCHLKVDHKCPYASPGKLNIEYIDSC